MSAYTLDRVATARNDLIRDVVAYSEAVERLRAAVTPANIKRHTETVTKSAAMIDASALALANAIAASPEYDLSAVRSAVARALRAIQSTDRSDASRKNGAAPVRDGSRPRGRPRKPKGPE